MCECVLAEVRGSATWDDYKKLEKNLKENSDKVTESGLVDLFPWFTDAVAACNT
jgi:hypothetical protein